MSDMERLFDVEPTLKPCPFCGDAANMFVQLIEPHWWAAEIDCCGIYKHACSARIVSQGDTRQEAIDNAVRNWNMRTLKL